MIARPPRVVPAPVPILCSKLLLVEGDTPMHFFEALLQHLGLEKEIETRAYGSITKLRSVLMALVATAEFRKLVGSIGIVRDAEQDAVAAQQSVADTLSAAGLTPAQAPQVRTAIFILPDNHNPGMIETLCMEAVRNEPTLASAYTCVEQFFACLQRNQVELPAPIVEAKNHAQAFLATRKAVQLFPGLAAYRGYWPWDNPAFNPIKQFLQNL